MYGEPSVTKLLLLELTLGCPLTQGNTKFHCMSQGKLTSGYRLQVRPRLFPRLCLKQGSAGWVSGVVL